MTGANSGVGYQTALGLARAGASVIVAARSLEKGRAAAAAIAAAAPNAEVVFKRLDLASLVSVKAFAEQTGPFDIFVNNAGVMGLPTRQATADGYEMQLGVNHLGHFALTLALLPALRAGKDARVVTVSSIKHKVGKIDLNDLNWERRAYQPIPAYDQSKLANLMFARELQHRLAERGESVVSFAAHPGIARTEIIVNGPGVKSWSNRLITAFQSVAAQSAVAGALPILYAATDPEAEPGGYYGPTGWREFRGPVGRAQVARQARDRSIAERLWAASETMTSSTL